MDTLYQQIREQVESDLQREQKTNETQKSQLSAHAKEKRLQNLLQRSRMARNHQENALEEHQEGVASPLSETLQPNSETDTVE